VRGLNLLMGGIEIYLEILIRGYKLINERGLMREV
jgi:hypothetical protein